MDTQEIKAEVLNDLIEINNDRITGYEKAIEELDDSDQDLSPIFREMIAESRSCNADLMAQVQATGSDVETGTTASGKIYRAWMDVKALFTGSDRKAVLASCERGEDAAQSAYASALEEVGLPAETSALITRQKQRLRVSHDKIKALRDSAL